jgi:hypothetical protein
LKLSRISAVVGSTILVMINMLVRDQLELRQFFLALRDMASYGGTMTGLETGVYNNS